MTSDPRPGGDVSAFTFFVLILYIVARHTHTQHTDHSSGTGGKRGNVWSFSAQCLLKISTRLKLITHSKRMKRLSPRRPKKGLKRQQVSRNRRWSSCWGSVSLQEMRQEGRSQNTHPDTRVVIQANTRLSFCETQC